MHPLSLRRTSFSEEMSIYGDMPSFFAVSFLTLSKGFAGTILTIALNSSKMP